MNRDFIRLTGLLGDVLLRHEMITGFVRDEEKKRTYVYLMFSEEPFAVKETVADILRKIDEAN